jgi:hypothetical protein
LGIDDKTKFGENFVLQGYHPLVFMKEELKYFGLRKSTASFALCRKKEFSEKEFANFCSKIPKEEG